MTSPLAATKKRAEPLTSNLFDMLDVPMPTFCEAFTVTAVVPAVCSCKTPDVSAVVINPPDVAALIMLAMIFP